MSKSARYLIPLVVLVKNSAVVAAISYFLTITLANYFGPAEFGLYVRVLIVSSIVSIFVNFGTDQTAAVSFVRSNDLSVVFADVFFTRLLVSIPTIGVVAYIYSQEIQVLLFVMCMTLMNFNLAFLYEVLRNNQRYSYIQLIERVSYVCLAFMLIYINYLNLRNLFFLNLFVTFMSVSYQFSDNRSYLRVSSSDVIKKSFLVFHENLPLVLIALSTYAYGGFSRLVLERQLGSESLGIYSAGWQLITIGTLYQAQISRIWRVDISESVQSNNWPKLRKNLCSYGAVSTLPMLAVCAFFLGNSELIVNILFTESYGELNAVLPVLGVYFLVINFSALVDMLWIALRRNGVYLLLSLTSGAAFLSALILISKSMTMTHFAISVVTAHFLAAMLFAAVWIYFFRQRIRKC